MESGGGHLISCSQLSVWAGCYQTTYNVHYVGGRVSSIFDNSSHTFHISRRLRQLHGRPFMFVERARQARVNGVSRWPQNRQQSATVNSSVHSLISLEAC